MLTAPERMFWDSNIHCMTTKCKEGPENGVPGVIEMEFCKTLYIICVLQAQKLESLITITLVLSLSQ